MSFIDEKERFRNFLTALITISSVEVRKDSAHFVLWEFSSQFLRIRYQKIENKIFRIKLTIQ